MSERTQQIDRDEARRRAYLLGALSEEERDELEARFFDDEDEFARLMETQYDVIDAYARGELSAGEHAQVEQRLLNTPEGRRRERVARALHRRVARGVQPAADGPGAASLVWRVLPAALIAASLIAIVWLGFDNARLRRELASADAQQSAIAPAPAETVAPASPESLVAAVTLSPQVLRSARDLQVVRFPPLSRVVRLVLPINEPATRFTVGLERAGAGRVLTLAGVVRTEEDTLIVWVSRDALQPGDYEALVWRGPEAPSDLVGVYAFRVAQP